MIRIAEQGGIGVITLHRPDVRNALTPGMLEELAAQTAEVGARSRCLVLAGEGRVFCAGFDLALCRESPDGAVMRALLTGLDAAVRAMRACPCPVVAACRGAAIAGGCALVAGADFAVADRAAKLGYPVVLLGVSPAVSGPTLAPRVGAGPARARMLDPGLISGEEAARIGLVTDLVEEPGAVLPAAMALAVELGRKGPHALAATKRWLGALDGTGTGEGAGGAAGGNVGPDGLRVSLGLAGGVEEAELLEKFWSRRG
ncbi:MAG: enoyl-CoA hydratase/isomerase family protein [Phycisphaerales bacterium]|nr:enoyl-CoA hydratase/isomerase family protein [Phycisphaerales bacterium]